MLFRLKVPIEMAIEIYPEVLRIFEEGSSEEIDRLRDSQKTTFLMNRLRTVFGPLLPNKEKHRCWIQKTSQRGMSFNTSCCKIFIFISFVCAAYENYEAFPVIFRTWIPQWTHNSEPHECTIFEALLATCMPKGVAIMASSQLL